MNQNQRFAGAMAAYGLLALLAGVTLDGKLRYFIWILMGGLAARTYVAWRAKW